MLVMTEIEIVCKQTTLTNVKTVRRLTRNVSLNTKILQQPQQKP